MRAGHLIGPGPVDGGTGTQGQGQPLAFGRPVVEDFVLRDAQRAAGGEEQRPETAELRHAADADHTAAGYRHHVRYVIGLEGSEGRVDQAADDRDGIGAEIQRPVAFQARDVDRAAGAEGQMARIHHRTRAGQVRAAAEDDGPFVAGVAQDAQAVAGRNGNRRVIVQGACGGDGDMAIRGDLTFVGHVAVDIEAIGSDRHAGLVVEGRCRRQGGTVNIQARPVRQRARAGNGRAAVHFQD